MRAVFHSRWTAAAASALLLVPLCVDAAHHLLGFEMRLPHSAHMHRWRALAPAVFAIIAVAAVVALRRTQNKLERAAFAAIVLWFVYEGIRFAAWIRTHHLLQGPYSWIFWIPATALLIARTAQLWQHRNLPD